MKLPESVVILGRRWKLSIKELPDEDAGECDKHLGHIYIAKGMSEKQFDHTVIHEMGHALINRMGLDQVLSSDIEEIVTESFATFFLENVLPLEIDKRIHQETGEETTKK